MEPSTTSGAFNASPKQLKNWIYLELYHQIDQFWNQERRKYLAAIVWSAKTVKILFGHHWKLMWLTSADFIKIWSKFSHSSILQPPLSSRAFLRSSGKGMKSTVSCLFTRQRRIGVAWLYKQAGNLYLFQLVENLQTHIEYSVLLNETTQIVNKMTQIIQDPWPRRFR